MLNYTDAKSPNDISDSLTVCDCFGVHDSVGLMVELSFLVFVGDKYGFALGDGGEEE